MSEFTWVSPKDWAWGMQHGMWSQWIGVILNPFFLRNWVVEFYILLLLKKIKSLSSMLAFSTKPSLKKFNLCYQKKWILNALLHSQVQWDIYACMRPNAEWSSSLLCCQWSFSCFIWMFVWYRLGHLQCIAQNICVSESYYSNASFRPWRLRSSRFVMLCFLLP